MTPSFLSQTACGRSTRFQGDANKLRPVGDYHCGRTPAASNISPIGAKVVPDSNHWEIYAWIGVGPGAARLLSFEPQLDKISRGVGSQAPGRKVSYRRSGVAMKQLVARQSYLLVLMA